MLNVNIEVKKKKNYRNYRSNNLLDIKFCLIYNNSDSSCFFFHFE